MSKHVKTSRNSTVVSELERQIFNLSSRDPVQERLTDAPFSLSEYMATIGRKGGKIGGKRRMETMTFEERRKIAQKAAKARWKKARKSRQ
jgi:hypothetical protein